MRGGANSGRDRWLFRLAAEMIAKVSWRSGRAAMALGVRGAQCEAVDDLPAPV